MQGFVKALNRFYLANSTLWEQDFSWEGFSWISNDDCDQSVIAFRRINKKNEELVVVCNFVPVNRTGYRIGLPQHALYKRVFSSDAVEFSGSGKGCDVIKSQAVPMHGYDYSAEFEIPALSVMYYKASRVYKTAAKKEKAGRKGKTE